MTGDCIHHVSLCPTCGGLEAARLDRVPGISGITITFADGTTETSSPTSVYIGPAPTPCHQGDEQQPTA